MPTPWPRNGVRRDRPKGSFETLARATSNHPHKAMAPQVPKGKLLELDVVSAQDLAPVSKSMRTYVVAWVRPDRKLTTRVDEMGNANPTWNEKFVFKVDEETLESDTAEISIEIYALTWLRVILTGMVNVKINELVPSSCRTLGKGGNSAKRFFTLQIHRPSGRPQGTIHIGVALVNSNMRSMPLQSELSVSTYMSEAVPAAKETPRQNPNDTKIQLWRSRSERTEDKYYTYYPGSVCNDSIVNGEQAMVRQKGGGGGGGGSVLGMGSLVSDIGPSASVVAAAIAKGIYPRRMNSPADDGGSSILTEQDSVEGLKTRIERWRTEMPPLYDRKNGVPNPRGVRGGARGGGKGTRRHSDGGGLFSCFGNAYGCEFSINIGGGATAKKKNV